ncbi:hypothetical protein [Saccharomonospora viridis]|uniref:Uncharacterized protein n=1 Tax=Saccharomonospora viridis TaxID=1852 RepID=A0A837DCA1_9PSEU|nr:hypothetical protein [Saccharomonospora viridis]KHF45227.1 hypothetical protein MINT15_21090 [Saccharomonospora viridis]SFP09695.1 hypothetical protein SAMN02982918_1222 [Saccharomonospora viridis]
MVVELLHRQDGGELPAEGLCALADRLAGLAADLHIRAAEIDGVVLATCCRNPTALPHWQWEALEEVLAEMCERTHGSLEDLHDRGRGILETCRPTDRSGETGSGIGSLQRQIHQVIGAPTHLVEAAPEDTRAVRATSHVVADLARPMLSQPESPTP